MKMKYPEERLLKDLYVKLPQKTTFKLEGREYTIPEGYEAEIKDGRIVISKKESKDKRTEGLQHNFYPTIYDIPELNKEGDSPIKNKLP